MGGHKVKLVSKDILMDIDESPISDEERSGINARKEALGSNFQLYPPGSFSGFIYFISSNVSCMERY